METPLKRKQGIRLAALFGRYLLTTGAAILTVILGAYLVFVTVLCTGLVLPANTAMTQVEALGMRLSEGSQTVEQIPYYFRWACLDADGQVIKHTEKISERRLADLQEAVKAKTMRISGFPYAQYHKIVTLPDGIRCVLQYDFAPPYGLPVLQAQLPDFQYTVLLFVLILCGVSALLCTRRYAKILRKDIAVLTSASQCIAEKRLDVPFTGSIKVRELGETLGAMEQLRQNLAQSLKEQWAMEQRRAGEIAALTHDLKTPLTIISGNSELLAEEALTPEQHKSVQTIFRNAQRMSEYMGQLRVVAGQDMGAVQIREQISLQNLFAEWRGMGEGLCVPSGILFCAIEPEEQVCTLCKEQISRAVLNLLDNAARYTPKGGKVTLSAVAKDGILTVCVTDTGTGFSQEALEKAGNAFYTEDRSRPIDGHMGMGLCFVRRIAQEHGGQLVLANTESGACVQMTLKTDGGRRGDGCKW